MELCRAERGPLMGRAAGVWQVQETAASCENV